MDESIKSIMIGLGALSLLYLLFRYILPLLFKVVGYVLGGVLYLAIGVLIVMGLIWAFSFLMNKMKNG